MNIPNWLHELRKRTEGIMYLYSRDWWSMEKTETVGLGDKPFNKHSRNSGHHVSPLGNGMIQVGVDGIKVRLIQGLDEGNLKRVLSMATRATIGWDPEEAEDDNADWEEMLRGGLQTALESQVVVFAVSGVSRTCTHQLVRTRKAAFHQSSQRASYLGDRPEMRIPESVWNSNNNVRVAWEAAILAAHKAYQLACEADIAYQDARFILPEGTDNFIVLEYPLREFINVYSYRACYMFQWEISHVMRECRRVLLESIKEPAVRAAIYDALKISCQKTGPAAVSTGEIDPETQSPVMKLVPHHCTFQGWESPEGHCPFEWALDEARTFKPKHHRI